jgi:predicted O-methyltransferase YrrM
MSEYTIDRGRGVRERMDLLAASHAPGTLSLFDLLEVPQVGAQCIDFGCGGGHVALELARRVGADGRVVGVDLDAELLALARKDAESHGLEHVTFRIGAVEDASDKGFDLAFARMLLSHLREPGEMVARMTSAVRPGGMVIVEDVHFAGCFTEPQCDAYDQWVGWFKAAVRGTGGDLDIGPRLPGLLRAAGLTKIGMRVAQPAFVDDPKKQLQQMSMEKVRAAVLGAGLASVAEYDAAHEALKAFTNDPTTVVAAPRMIQAWGRRP